MRINLKHLLIALCVFVFVVIFSFLNCDELSMLTKWNVGTQRSNLMQAVEDIECIINNQYTIGCKKNADEVYLPFSFLNKYFEVYGSLVTEAGATRFDWSHSYGKVNHPKSNYDSRGIFMYFENYNVEMRDRVKCISAAAGVPISTQWETQGYFYATQIAQFGLSHYSKNLTEPEPRKKVIEDGDQNQNTNWLVEKNSTMSRDYDHEKRTNIINFQTTNNSALTLKLDHVLDLVMSLDLLFHKANSCLSVTVQNRETQKLYVINYLVSDTVMIVQDNIVYYGLGSSSTSDVLGSWRKLTRDLYVDLHKSLPPSHQNQEPNRRKIRRAELKITSIAFLGTGSFDNITLATNEHIAQFYDAAEWFVKNQDLKTGGWPIPVKRKLGSGFTELGRGWYSAMSQGHAISLLARAYYHSKGDTRYLKAAIDGMKPFRVAAQKGGVRTHFLGKYVWFEEYPTSPPSFVLNGFIYSLLGLYDLYSIATHNISNEASVLFEQGMHSLKKMLTLYDTGSGSSYDLRHFTLGIAPNLARWDYHATHVNQLLLLATIDKDPLIIQTAERWKSYMFGKRAAHN